MNEKEVFLIIVRYFKSPSPGIMLIGLPLVIYDSACFPYSCLCSIFSIILLFASLAEDEVVAPLSCNLRFFVRLNILLASCSVCQIAANVAALTMCVLSLYSYVQAQVSWGPWGASG